jgi:hypothetical protein
MTFVNEMNFERFMNVNKHMLFSWPFLYVYLFLGVFIIKFLWLESITLKKSLQHYFIFK